MSEQRFRPGPWRMVGREARGLAHSLVGAETLLARVYSKNYGDVEEETATALLVAAAPELLVELENLISLAEDAMRMANEDGAEFEIGEELAGARAAIGKALGTNTTER